MIGARLLAGVLALTLIGSACTGDSPVVTPTDAESTQTSPPPQGGSVVLGAEVWPECLNPITECAIQPWTHYTVLQHVLPRAMEIDPAGKYVASPLLDQAPSLANGGLDPGPPFRITFRIRDEAVWDDGSPITSEDFAFTWRAIMSTGGSIGRETHGRIEAIDTSDPKTAVITLDDAWAGWPELFGGAHGYLLKASAFPELSASDSPDLNNELLDAIPFSGGPFRLASWTREQAVLVRNDRYLGVRPSFETVRFLRPSGDDELVNSLFTGRVSAIFAEQTEVEWPPSISPNIKGVGADSVGVEALWFHHDQPPLDNPRVREALMYGIDRQALIDSINKAFNASASVLNCGLGALPHLGPWCQARPFERFTYDPGRARSMLEAAGYRCGGEICKKHGEPLVIRYFTLIVSPLRTLTQELIIDQARAAGIELRPVTFKGSGALLDRAVCRWVGKVAIVGCSRGRYADGSVTNLLACDRVPTEENLFMGENFIRWCNPEATRLMHESDRELDPGRRLELLTRVHELQGEDFVSLPLYLYPVVSAWRTDKIAGPIGPYSSTPYGMFFNMNEWYVPA